MKSYSLAATLHKSFKSPVTQPSYLSEDLNKIEEMTEKEDFCVHFLPIYTFLQPQYIQFAPGLAFGPQGGLSSMW